VWALFQKGPADFFDPLSAFPALLALIFVKGHVSLPIPTLRQLKFYHAACPLRRIPVRGRYANARPESSSARDKLIPMTPARNDGTPEPGSLYLVATPIGNLEDITVRALRVLGEVDLVACEDTRQTAKLLQHYGLRKRMVSYHEHNELTRSAELVLKIEAGARVALVSDAGTPMISDPGHHLVALCLRHHLAVIPIPGPSALTAALAASGLPFDEFVFLGFLPSRGGERRKALSQLAAEERTLVLYESPHRLAETLADALERLGRRQAVIAREVTKLHEEFLRGDLAELLVRVQRQALRGEITVLIAGAEPGGSVMPLPAETLRARVEQIMRDKSLDRKAALKAAAKERGLTKRQAYKELLSSD
jgi:16S rRNA (cytidine1402-2'-O)-methyltransferase